MALIFNALLFAAPCWIVNISLNGLYVIGKFFPKFKNFDTPLDGGRTLRYDSRRILGNSTTIPGIIVALASGLLIAHYTDSDLTNGFILGLSVYLGHALGSFIKRRAGYYDGQFMPLVDHGDYIVTAGLIFWYLEIFSTKTVILGIAATYILHPAFTYLAYLLGFHKYPS